MTRKYLRGLAWGFYFLGAVLLAVTFMPGLALGGSQAAPNQDPALYVVGVSCHDKLYVMFRFQLQNWGQGQPPGAVSYTVNGNGYTAPEWKQNGSNVSYLGLVPTNGSQSYDLTAANAGPYNLKNPGTYNVPCGQASTATDTPTITPTPTGSLPPPTNTATPTQPGGGNATKTPTSRPGGQATNTPIVGQPTAVSTPVALAPTTGNELAVDAISRLQVLGTLAVGLILMGLALQWASKRLNQQG